MVEYGGYIRDMYSRGGDPYAPVNARAALYGIGQQRLSQRRQDLQLAENQRQFNITSGMQRQELEANIQAQQRQYELAQRQASLSELSANRQYGFGLYQAGLPGYGSVLGVQQRQYNIPGSGFTLYGAPAQTAATQLATAQYEKGQGLGQYYDQGGMSFGGGATMQNLQNLYTQASFMPNRALGRQLVGEIQNQMQSMLRQQRIRSLRGI